MPSTAKAQKGSSTAETIKEEAKETLRATADASRKKIEQEAIAAKASAANTVDDTASQMRDAADAFDADSLINQAASRLADNLSQAATAIRTKDLHTVQSELVGYARRNPLVFFGGAALLGLATARMMKASDTTQASVDPGFPASRADVERGEGDAWGYSK